MSDTYLQTVILHCLNQINGERSIYSVFHILKGKKSSQSIQDGHLFQIARFFQTFPVMTRDDFEGIIASCQSRKWLLQIKDQHFQLSIEGKLFLKHQLDEKPFPEHVNGWTFHSLTDTFWERLSLLIQVCSNLVHQKSQYVPIQRKYEVQSWLKSFLNNTPKSRMDISEQLHMELVSCLENESSINPAVFVIRLTGHDHIGLTPDQAAMYFGQEVTYFQFQFINVLHYLLKDIQRQSECYPLLFTIIKDLKNPFSFTISTKKTYNFLKSGLTLDQIANARNLKRSTIEDHIVEIALNDKQFDISTFVQTEKQHEILEITKKMDTKQLKYIRNLTKDASYFEIRLVMAKYGEQQWN